MSQFRFVHSQLFSPAPEDGDPASQPPNQTPMGLPRRRKIRLACNGCRESKSRCDGQRPICSRCASKQIGHRCVYESEALNTQRYVTQLENRIFELEARCRQALPSGQDQAPTLDNPPSDDDSIDRGDALIMVPSPEGNLDDNGSSISASLQTIAHLVGRSDLVDRTVPRTGKKPVSPLRQKRSSGILARNTSSLPPRPVADAIMLQYWTYVHPIFPVLHRPTAEWEYESLWVSDFGGQAERASEKPTLMAMLNIMFALSCQVSSQEDEADNFYRKSRDCYSMDTIDLPSLETVQLMLLTGIYLQTTKYASRCWNIVGMALRCARYLRLDQGSPRNPPRSQLEEEMCRRVWHSCLIIERLLALIFSQPPTTGPAEDRVPLPSLIDDQYLNSSGSSTLNSDWPSSISMAFFVHSIEFFQILNNILTDIYHTPSADHASEKDSRIWWPSEKLPHILRLNKSLDSLDKRIPVHLREIINTESPYNMFGQSTDWQGYVFRCRFLYVKILVLRPVLMSAAAARMKKDGMDNQPRTQETLEEMTARNCCFLCIETVHTLANHISKRLESGNKYAMWREPHYALFCAIVVFIARLCPFTEDGFSDSALNSTWMRSVMILEHFKTQIQSVNRAIEILQCLDSRVNELRECGKTGRSWPPMQESSPGSEDHAFHISGLGTLFESNNPLFTSGSSAFGDWWVDAQMGGFGTIAQTGNAHYESTS